MPNEMNQRAFVRNNLNGKGDRVAVDAFNRMRDVLTKEQRDQLTKLQRGGGMMGPGYRHGSMMGQ